MPATTDLLAGLWQRARDHADDPALVDPLRRVTHGELWAEAGHLAAVFSNQGVAPGTTVAFCLGNTCEALAAQIAIWRCQATAVPLDPLLGPQKVRQMLAPLRPRVLLGRHGRQAAAPPGCLFLDHRKVASEITAEAAPPPASAPGEPAVVFFTSGSTGTPKGVTLSHAAFLANAHLTADLLEAGADDRAGVFLPVSGRISQSIIFGHLLRGGAAVLELGFMVDDSDLLERFARHGVTNFSCVPTQLRILLRRGLLADDALPALRAVRVGAGPLAAADAQQLLALRPRLRLYATYGMTEVGEISALAVHHGPRPGSVGRPVADLELTIVDDAGAPLPHGSVGEVVVQSPRLMSGYWGHPHATGEPPAAAATTTAATTTATTTTATTTGAGAPPEAPLHTGDPAATATGATRPPGTGDPRDTPLRTGDLGRLDHDGFLYLEGRVKDLIKVAGENVSGNAIEAELLAVPGVREAAVVAVADRLLGEAPCAWVVADEGTTVDDATLSRAFAATLPRASVPRRIYLLPELPRLPSGKVDRLALRARYAAKEGS